MGDAYTKEAYKLIYQHPDWQATAQEYEDRFAANLYHTGYVQEAARTALTKLSDTLVSYYRLKGSPPEKEQMESMEALGQVAGQVSGRRPDDWKVLEETLLQRNSASGAGQIGRRMAGDKATRWDVMRLDRDNTEPLTEEEAARLNQENMEAVISGNGNLREQMTMLYNGMFLNGGKTTEEIARSRSLKNLLLNITPEEMEQMKRMGVDADISFDLLKEMGHYDSREDLFDTYSMARDLKRGRDKMRGRGNFLTRWASGIRRAFNAAFSSKFTRNTKSAEERKGLGRDHYDHLNLGLSVRESANGVVDGQLQWKEGQSYFRMDTPVTADGMLQTAGPSGTTLRMLGAYRLLGAGKTDLLFFRLALIAWMVSSRDHSLYEILKGSHNAGVKGWEDLSEAALMYRTVDPLEEEELRNRLAPNHRFPHETVFLKIVDEFRKKQGKEALAQKVLPGEDAYEEVDATEQAIGYYTGDLYIVMNVAQKYGDIAAHMMLDSLSKDPESAEKLNLREVKASAYDIARLSSRMAQEGLEERGRRKAAVEEMEEYDAETAEMDPVYQAERMDSSRAYRGITYRGGKLSKIYRGTGSFITKGFLSTSLSTQIAKHFYDETEEPESNTAFFKFYLDGKGSVNITDMSQVSGEMEVLVPAGTKFEIVEELQKAYYNKKTYQLKFAKDLTPQEKSEIEDGGVTEEEDGVEWERMTSIDWEVCQMVGLKEISGPDSEKRARMEEKRAKRAQALRRLRDSHREFERSRERKGA